MRCVNCGADVSGSKCEYCGTTYERTRNERNIIKATFSEDSPYGQLRLGKETLNVYMSSMEIETRVPSYPARDISGKIYREKPVIKRRFMLIEI